MIFGSYRQTRNGINKIWSQIAVNIGGEFIKGSFWKSGGYPAIVYKYGEWQIRLDASDRGDENTTYLMAMMRTPFINKDGLYFKIYRKGGRRHWQVLRNQDIEIGDPFFDEQFIIKSNNPEKMKLFLADPKIKELIQDQPVNHEFQLLEIRDDEGWFGTNFPEGVDELYFECGDIIRDHRRLKSLFDLFSVRLVQIDSAYEDDPKVYL